MARIEAGSALEDMRHLAERLGERASDEAGHESAARHLSAALSHLDSIRVQQTVGAAA